MQGRVRRPAGEVQLEGLIWRGMNAAVMDSYLLQFCNSIVTDIITFTFPIPATFSSGS